jgi:8-oxo-dGTP pyrophosphatase MutT (NUDIX family)
VSDIEIVRVARLALAFVPRPWPFAVRHRAEIEAYFAAARRERPAMWNGRILMLHEHGIEDGVFSGAFFETDYASFLAWRDWDAPDASVKNCFSMAALRAGDGGFLLGLMGAQTGNAGKVYFPSGMPEPADVADGSVDLAGNMLREVAEETGLAAGELAADEGWHCVFAGLRIGLMKVLRAREPAERLRERILAHLARDKAPEFADILITRGPADLDPRTMPFVAAFLAHVWS